MSLLTSRNITGGTEILTNPTLDNMCSGWDKTENGVGNTVTFHEGYANIKTVSHAYDDHGLRQYVSAYNAPLVATLTVRFNSPSTVMLYSINKAVQQILIVFSGNTGETRTITRIWNSLDYRVCCNAWSDSADFDVLEFSVKPLHGGTPIQQRLIASTDTKVSEYRKGCLDTSTMSGSVGFTSAVPIVGLDIASNITAECWIKPTFENREMYVMGRWENGAAPESTSWLLGFHSNNKVIALIRKTDLSTQSLQQSTTTLPSNTWSHIAFTYDGSMMRLYINGIETDSYATTGDLHIPTIVSIRMSGLNLPGYHFNGQIDNCRIWNRVLSATEILTNMTATFDTRPNLVANWRFDDVGLPKLADSSGNNNYINITSIASLKPSDNANLLPYSAVKTQRIIETVESDVLVDLDASDYTGGKLWLDRSKYKRDANMKQISSVVNGYVVYDGGSKIAELGDYPLIYGKKEFTMFVEFKIDTYRSGPRDWMAIAGKGNYQDGAWSVLLNVVQETNRQLNFYSKGSILLSVNVPNLLLDTNYKVVYTRSGDILSCYLNGTLLGSTIIPAIPILVANGVGIGYEFGGSNYALSGGVKRFRVYNRALNTTEINTL